MKRIYCTESNDENGFDSQGLLSLENDAVFQRSRGILEDLREDLVALRVIRNDRYCHHFFFSKGYPTLAFF